MTKYFGLLLFILFSSIISAAQITTQEALLQRLSGKTKFYDIKNEVDNFYVEQLSSLRTTDSSKRKALMRQLKKWNRWLYESESHLNVKGAVENAALKIYEATQQAAAGAQPAGITAAYGNWTSVGPNYVEKGIGRVNCIAFHPTNANIIYAGAAAGGLWQSNNGGTNWFCISAYTPSLGVSGIVISKNNPAIIYVLTGDGDAYSSGGFTFKYGYIRYSVGVLKTYDGGVTWQRTGSLPGLGDSSRYVGFKLLQDPSNENVLYAATNRGLYKTINGGDSWFLCNITRDYTADTNGTAFDIEFKPGNSSTLYVAFNDNLYLSTDAGINFRASTNFSSVSRIAIAVSAANPNYVYLLTGPGYLRLNDASNNTFHGLFRSVNSGVSFSMQTDHPDILGLDNAFTTQAHQSGYDLAFAASPSNANLVVTGGLTAWRSGNGGVDMTEIVDYFWDLNNGNYIHPDIHDLAYNPLNGKLYACTDGGVSVSSDNGNGWTRLFNGLNITQFYHFNLSNWSNNLWAGAQDNGVLQQLNSGTTFDHYAQGDGYDVMNVNVNGSSDYYYVVNTDIYKYGSISDAAITPVGFSAEYFPNLAHHPTKDNVIYAGFSGLCVSTDKGSNWNITGAAGNWCISACPTNGSRVYAAGYRGTALFSRHDNLITAAGNFNTGNSLTNLMPALEAAGYPTAHPKITGIAVNQDNADIIAVSVSGYYDHQKVFISYDAGNSFRNISGDNSGTYSGLPNLPVNCITFDSHGGLYIGTDIGVYYKVNGYLQWTPFYTGLPRVPVSGLIFAITIEIPSGNIIEKIYACTYGRGVWVSDAYSDCATTLTVTAPQSGQQFYQAASSVVSSSVISGGSGTNVNMKGGSVTLTEGFNAQQGNEFRAYTGTCSIGLPVDRARKNSILRGRNKLTKITVPAGLKSSIQAGEKKSSSNETIHIKKAATEEDDD